MQEFAVPPLQGMMQIMLWKGLLNSQIIYLNFIMKIVLILTAFVCLCWGFTAQ